MAAEPHIELTSALKNYRLALERLAASAREAAAVGDAKDAWPVGAMRVWWQFTRLDHAGASKALKAWRGWEGLGQRQAERHLRSLGRYTDADKGSFGRWERGESTPNAVQRRDLEAVIGVPPGAWDAAD